MEKTLAVLFAPAPVWKPQRSLPLLALYACSCPLLRPTKAMFPFVEVEPL
jgi:hypothetical protein